MESKLKLTLKRKELPWEAGFAPSLVSFSSGIAPPELADEEAESLQVRVKEGKRARLLLADTDTMRYQCRREKRESPSAAAGSAKSGGAKKRKSKEAEGGDVRYLLAVCDRKQRTLTVLDGSACGEMWAMGQSVKNYKPKLFEEEADEAGKKSYRERTKSLLQEFGTYRERLNLRNYELNAVNGLEIGAEGLDSMVQVHRDRYAEDAEMVQADLPPCDRTTNNASKIYRLRDLLGKRLKAAINRQMERVFGDAMHQKGAKKKWVAQRKDIEVSPEVLELLEMVLLETNVRDKATKILCFGYLLVLRDYYDRKTMRRDRSKDTPEDDTFAISWPSSIYKMLDDAFATPATTQRGKTLYLLSNAGRSLLTNHMIVAALKMNGNTVTLPLLRKFVKLPLVDLKNHLRIVGCRVAGKKEAELYKLHAPLGTPKDRRGATQKLLRY